MGAIYKSKTKYSSSQYTQMRILPDAGLRNLGKVFQYIGQTTDSLTHGFFYECTYDNENEEYIWVPVNVQEASIGQSIQFNEMPEASQNLLGKIYQYTGETDENFNNGSFYKCIATEEDPVTYEWIPIIQEFEPINDQDVQDIIDNNPPSARIQFTEYSLNEQIIGRWIDGKPLYQKTASFTTPNVVGLQEFSYLPSIPFDSMDTLISIDGFAMRKDGWRASFNFYSSATWFSLDANFTTRKLYFYVMVNSTSGTDGQPAVATFQYTKTTDIV